MVFLQILGLILLTDLFTGAVHWWEDAYGNPDWKYLGKSVVLPNMEHHRHPRGFLKGTFWERIRLSFYVALGIGLICWYLNLLNWQLIFSLCYASVANEIHAIAHRTDNENGKFIVFVQKIGMIQSRKMHGLHHSSPYNINYCVLTNYLNPILNKIHFWHVLEKMISILGIRPTRENVNRGGY